MQQIDPGSLSRLHDVVAPEPVPFWPPAPGWIALLALAALAAVAFAWLRWRAWRAAAYRREASAELAALVDGGEWGRLSELVKRTALAAFPRAEVASLHGEAWLAFLDRTGGTHDFSDGPGRHLPTLAHDPRAGERVPPAEAREAAAVCAVWIRRHRSNGEDAT